MPRPGSRTRTRRALTLAVAALLATSACGRGADVDRPASGGGLEGDSIAPVTPEPATSEEATTSAGGAEETGQPTLVPEVSLSDFDHGSPADDAEGTFTATPGECLAAPRPGARISCDSAHRAEVFYTFNLAGGDYPGDDAVRDRSTAQCSAQVAAYLGGEPENRFSVAALTPSEETWEDGDTEVLCLITSEDARTGSVFQSLS